MILQERINEYLKLADEATEGPWFSYEGEIIEDRPIVGAPVHSIGLCSPRANNSYGMTSCCRNAAFIAASREAPDLIRKLQEKLDVLMWAVDEMDCTCGSEGHSSDHSYKAGECFKHDALERVKELEK